MRRYFEEGLAGFGTRVRNGGARKPARSLMELAEEFGVTRHALTALIRTHNGPEPAFRMKTYHAGSVWYEYEAFCKWWRSLPTKEKP